MSPRSRLPLVVTSLLAVAALLVGCGDDGASTTSTGASSGGSVVTVTGAWARTSAGGQVNGAAYLVINGGATADRLISASAPVTVAKTTEIHETVMASGGTTMAHSHSSGSGMADTDKTAGMMSMRPVTGIDVPANGKVELKQGGYHVMFINLAKPLAKGDTFTLTLTFEKAGKVDVPIEVKDAA